MGPTIITDIVSLRERGNYTSLMAFVWAVGTNAGVRPMALSNCM